MNEAYYKAATPELFSPTSFNGFVNCKYDKLDNVIADLKQMLLIRFAEEMISNKVVEGLIKCPCHLGIGQEAVAVGVAKHLRKTDSVFGAHRSHSHFLAMNNDAYSLFAETLGRFDGCSHGLGGSMHLIDSENGFYGSVPIVAATIPIAVGAGFAHKLDAASNIAVSYFGDGATEEGVFHESMNLAKINNLPVLFVCENNLFASHMHILERQPELSTLRFANAHGIESLTVDGNDVSAVFSAAKLAIDHIRNSNGPFFLEFITYRWKGHVGPSDDNDVGLQRNDELKVWKGRDPIRRLVDSLLNNNLLTNSDVDEIIMGVKQFINDSWQKALQSQYPEVDYLMSIVYSK